MLASRRKVQSMRIAQTSTIRIPLDEALRAMLPQIEAELDADIPLEAIEVSYNARSKSFTLTVDMAWEAAAQPAERAYEHELVLEPGEAGRHKPGGRCERPELGSPIQLVLTDGAVMDVVCSDVEGDGDVWVFDDGDEHVVRNGSTDQEDPFHERVAKIRW